MTRTSRLSLSFICCALLGAGCLPQGPNGSGQNGTGAVYFYPDVQATMDVIGCSSQDCHGANDTPMHVVPPSQGGDINANYQQVMPRTAGAEKSLFLTKPVQGAAIMHEGGKLIPMNGQTYNQLLAWIQAGAPLAAPGAKIPPPGAVLPPVAGAPGDMGTTAAPPPATGDGGVVTSACVPVQPTKMSSHNKGQDCLTCHATGQNPLLRWTVAGTLWQDTFGTTPRGGATVTIVDGKGLTISLVTDVEGNFYTAQAVTFPLSVSASGCPSTKAMVGKPPQGSCNTSGCHDAGRPIYLP
jgi:hypothetical protein